MSDLESVIAGSLSGIEGRGDEGADPVEPTETADDTSVDTGADDISSTETDTSTDDAAETDDAEKTTSDAETDDDAEVDPLEDPFAKEHGLKEPKPGERENRLPYTRVKAIVGNAQKKLYKSITGEDLPAGVSVEQGIQTFTGRLTQLVTSARENETRLQSYDKVEAVMVEDPERFLKMLPSVNPKYAELLSGSSTVQQAGVDSNSPRPEPDLVYTLPDGTQAKTYSVEQLEKLTEWQTAQAEKRIQAIYDKRLKPFEEERESQTVQNQMLTQIRAHLKSAESWEGFNEHKTDVLAKLKQDQALSLFDAYRLVVIPKFKADRERMRAEILAELKKAPKSTSVAPGTVVKKAVTPQAKSGPQDLEDVIRASIKTVPGR